MAVKAAFVSAVLMLAACSPGGGEKEQRNEPTAPPQPVHATALPDAFVGRWGLAPADCDPKLDYAAKGLMVVGATELRFYEARAKVGSVTIDAPGHVIAALAWSGEGMTWSTTTPLSLDPDGKGLVRLDHETHRELRYARCPAQPSETR